MIIRPKDHIYWEVLFDTQEEAEAFKDYWERVFVRGYAEWQTVFTSPNTETETGRSPKRLRNG